MYSPMFIKQIYKTFIVFTTCCLKIIQDKKNISSNLNLCIVLRANIA